MIVARVIDPSSISDWDKIAALPYRLRLIKTSLKTVDDLQQQALNCPVIEKKT